MSTKDAYPLPQVNATLDKLRGARYLLPIDLKDGYWYIPLTERTKPLTAFTVPGNLLTGHSPAYLNSGRELKPPGSLAHEVAAPEAERRQHRLEKLLAVLELARAQMAKSFQNQQKHYNLRRRRWAPEVGEELLKKTHHLSCKTDSFNAKLTERYDRPYTVFRIITSVIFDLKDKRRNTARRANVKDLKPLQSELT